MNAYVVYYYEMRDDTAHTEEKEYVMKQKFFVAHRDAKEFRDNLPERLRQGAVDRTDIPSTRKPLLEWLNKNCNIVP